MEKQSIRLTNGASVMMGDVGGVYALLKRDIPHLIKVHCIAHRLELAFLDTVKAVCQLEEAKDVTRDLETSPLLT